jgi:hypothetical protein
MLINIIAGYERQNQNNGFIRRGWRIRMKLPFDNLLLLCVFLFVLFGMINDMCIYTLEDL